MKDNSSSIFVLLLVAVVVFGTLIKDHYDQKVQPRYDMVCINDVEYVRSPNAYGSSLTPHLKPGNQGPYGCQR